MWRPFGRQSGPRAGLELEAQAAQEVEAANLAYGADQYSLCSPKRRVASLMWLKYHRFSGFSTNGVCHVKDLKGTVRPGPWAFAPKRFCHDFM